MKDKNRPYDNTWHIERGLRQAKLREQHPEEVVKSLEEKPEKTYFASDEARASMSKSHAGRPKPEAVKEKMRKPHGGDAKHRKGKTWAYIKGRRVWFFEHERADIMRANGVETFNGVEP